LTWLADRAIFQDDMLILALTSALALVAGDSIPLGAPLVSRRSAIFATGAGGIDTVRTSATAERDSLAIRVRLQELALERSDSSLRALRDSVKVLRLDSLRQDSLARRGAARQAVLGDSLARFRAYDSLVVQIDTLQIADTALRADRIRLRSLLAEAALRSGRSVLVHPPLSGFQSGRLLTGSLRRSRDSLWIHLELRGGRSDSVVLDRKGRVSDSADVAAAQRQAARDLFGLRDEPVVVPGEVPVGIRAAILASVALVALIVSVSLW